MKSAAKKLCDLVGKKYLLFTPRGNTSIKIALEVAKLRKYGKVLLQDQGGWLTYPQFVDKLKFEKVELKTDFGLVDKNDLASHKKSVLLINSMPAYAFLQDMEELYDEAKKNDILVINDASGSIGNDDARFGDVIIGSFGDDKPIDVGQGGFIATDDEELYKEFCELNVFVPEDDFLDNLEERLDALDDRLYFFEVARLQVIEDLKIYDIINPECKGINVIVKFNNDDEKNQLTAYCEDEKLEYTMCPRYIRVNVPAVSIEIKRLKEEAQPELNIDEEYDEAE